MDWKWPDLPSWASAQHRILNFTLLTHFVYINRVISGNGSQRSLPVGRVMTDPFSRCFSPGHKNLLLVSRTPLPRKKVGTIRREFVSLFYLFVATVKKKKAVLNPPQDTRVSFGRGAETYSGSYLGKCLVVLSFCFFI